MLYININSKWIRDLHVRATFILGGVVKTLLGIPHPVSEGLGSVPAPLPAYAHVGRQW